MEAILVTHCYDFPRPKMVRGVLAFATGYGLLTVEGDEHRAMRRLMTPSFSLAHLAQIVPDFYSSIDICVKLLNKAVEEQDDGDGAILDMYPRMSHLTLDIICQTAFGALSTSCW